MHTSTTNIGRRLIMLLLLAGLTISAQAQRTVTLQLNTATLADTVSATDELWIRGAIDGTAPFTLPDGNVIDWGAGTTLAPMNIGGDYWELEFQIPDDQPMAFKAFLGTMTESVGDGWEAGDNHSIDGGTGDVDLGLHYFELPDQPSFDWSPFEQKEDSVGVHFRVFMNTEDALTKGYAADGSNEIAVRGEPNGSVPNLDWGMNNFVLSQESDETSNPGYHIYSGIAYYPVSAAGTQQQYKFIVDSEGWENNPSDPPTGSGNREFNIPAQDTTLHWVFFSDSPPLTSAPVAADLTFSVDVSPIERVGVFSNIRGDTLQVRGQFNGWGCSPATVDVCVLEEQVFVPNQPWEREIGLNLVPPTELGYKYFIDFEVEQMQEDFGAEVVPSGWEEPYSTQGANRLVEYDGTDKTQAQVYNDLFPDNVIPAGNQVNVSFAVDMSAATTAAEPFDPATDSVTVYFRDPIWAFTQGMPLSPRGDDPNRGDGVDVLQVMRDILQLTDPDGDMVYEGSLNINGPTFNGLQYWYAYGQGTSFVNEPGAALETGGGARRVRFIVPNSDGSWPATWDIGEETYEPEGALPFDPNPAINIGIEPVDGEVPTRVSLGDNYPNPFNPTTSFEYTLDRTMDVSVAVFDVLGRRVATLVDGTQQAATYDVTFDASNLASGTYIYRLETPNQVITRTMVLLK